MPVRRDTAWTDIRARGTHAQLSQARSQQGRDGQCRGCHDRRTGPERDGVAVHRCLCEEHPRGSRARGVRGDEARSGAGGDAVEQSGADRRADLLTDVDRRRRHAGIFIGDTGGAEAVARCEDHAQTQPDQQQ